MHLEDKTPDLLMSAPAHERREAMRRMIQGRSKDDSDCEMLVVYDRLKRAIALSQIVVLAWWIFAAASAAIIILHAL